MSRVVSHIVRGQKLQKSMQSIVFLMLCLTFPSLHADESKRLSEHMLSQPSGSYYPLGTMWLVPEEQKSERELKLCLLDKLQHNQYKSFLFRNLLSPSNHEGLTDFLNDLPVTGRVPLKNTNPLWLQQFPDLNPYLRADDKLIFSKRPDTVTVVLDDGALCQVPFVSGAFAKTYIRICKGYTPVDSAWVAQPDGEVYRYGIAFWNGEVQNPPAPGAWIWAPNRKSHINHTFSNDFATFLATQGPAADNTKKAQKIMMKPLPKKIPTYAYQNPQFTANDWGMIGLIQMPSARMAAASDLRFKYTYLSQYKIGVLTLQPFDWLETAIHYVRIGNEEYGKRISNLALYDKGFDIKLRLLKESAYMPELSLGAQDMAGTGRFSGEYLVASKRFGRLDWTLGMAWGNLGAERNIHNPLAHYNSSFNRRGGMLGMGGEFNINQYLHGSSALFGGVQWHTPIDKLLLKAEYDSSYYRPTGNRSHDYVKKSAINVAGVYRISSWLDLTAGYERGNKGMVGLSVHSALDALDTPKLLDPPPVQIHFKTTPNQGNWAKTVQSITKQTNWKVKKIDVQGTVLNIEIYKARKSFNKARLEKLITILNEDAPLEVNEFDIVFSENDMVQDVKKVNRALWFKQHTEFLPPSILNEPSTLSFSPPFVRALTTEELLWQDTPAKYGGRIAPYFSQSIGGPDSFVLYQGGFYAYGEYKFTPSTFATGTAALRVLDNYNNFVYDGPSNMPRVRTNIRRYLTDSRFGIRNLQLTHVRQISNNQFVSAYAGLLEMMFAGVGGEWFYRPWHSPIALGVDANFVQQREFNQLFSLRDYQVATGQASIYWDTGFHGIMAKFGVGQYLAGDRGVEIDLSRRFKNGVVFGAYAVKTNVPAEVFGEGSFNKGIYISIPFDLFMPKSTPGIAKFNYQPLLRDGGARLGRVVSLYDITSQRGRSGCCS